MTNIVIMTMVWNKFKNWSFNDSILIIVIVERKTCFLVYTNIIMPSFFIQIIFGNMSSNFIKIMFSFFLCNNLQTSIWLSISRRVKQSRLQIITILNYATCVMISTQTDTPLKYDKEWVREFIYKARKNKKKLFLRTV